jgi:hypothetical protein
VHVLAAKVLPTLVTHETLTRAFRYLCIALFLEIVLSLVHELFWGDEDQMRILSDEGLRSCEQIYNHIANDKCVPLSL